MADYRGGDRHTSGHGDALIKAIREGRTEKQRRRNFEQKLAFTGVQAGLQGLRAGIGYAQSQDAEAERKAENRANYLKEPAPDYKPMAAGPNDAKVPAWVTGGAGDRTELAIDNDVLAAVKPESQYMANPYDTPETKKYEAEQVAYEAPSTWGTAKRGRGMMGSQ